jgi:heme exporter protein D
VSLGPHASFIIAAYAISAATLGALVIWIALGYRAQRKIIRDLESRESRH